MKEDLLLSTEEKVFYRLSGFSALTDKIYIDHRGNPGMKSCFRSMAFLTFLLVFVCQAAVLAAARPVSMTGMRYHGNDAKDRIVFDLSAVPQYTVKEADDGKTITIEFANTANSMKLKPAVASEAIASVSMQSVGQNLQVIISLKTPMDYKVQQLSNPSRIFIDISKEYERTVQEEAAPGLTHTTYVRRDSKGMLTAHFLEVDRSQYALKPVLGNGEILGREHLSSISDGQNAMAAVNASYFNPDGTLFGITKIDGTIVATTYFTRSGFALLADGRAAIGTFGYDGSVTIGKASVPIAGVNCEREENSLVLYNSYYNDTTGTNEFGREFIVRNGKIAAIQQMNSQIPQDGVVISVHGTARDAFTGVRVGDKVTIRESLGAPWDQASMILGVGPVLVRNGQVDVTAQAEQFPGDIAYGRAPRTAVGIMPNGHILLAVVDGRQASSIGCTLTEMGELMKKFGASDALNFDGGGSSEMILGGRILNNPSDGAERPLGCALVVVKK